MKNFKRENRYWATCHQHDCNKKATHKKISDLAVYGFLPSCKSHAKKEAR